MYGYVIRLNRPILEAIHIGWPCLLALVDEERTARYIKSFTQGHADSAARSLAAELLVRAMLCHRLGHARPQDLRMATGRYGKPFLAAVKHMNHKSCDERFPAAGLHFNISHSDDWIAACVGYSPNGIDIQTPPAKVSPSTLRRLGLPPDTSPAALAQAWAKHEAALKAYGLGLYPNPINTQTLNKPAVTLRSYSLRGGCALTMAELQ